MFNEHNGTIIDSKDIHSETYGKITIQAVFVEDVENSGKPYYEIRERYHFPWDDGKESVIYSEVTMTEEGIKKILDDYDLKYAEYCASCAVQAEEIHLTDPSNVPVL